MNDARLLERLAWADEYPPTTPLPDDIWTVDAISHEVERRTGMTQTTDHQAPETDQRSGRTRLVLAAAAAFVVVILFGAAMWAFTARQTGGEVIDAPPTTAAVPTTQAAPANPEAAGDIAFIELHVKTWFESGDFELAADQIGSSPREGGGGLASEVLYQAAIDARASVTDCKALDEPRTYQCTVGYSNMLFEALGEPAWLTTLEFRVVADDLLSPIPYDDRYPGKNSVNAAWLEFEREAGLADESSCEEIASNSVSCPELQREHLDEFVAWHAGTGSPAAEATDIAFIERFVDTWFESGESLLAATMIGETADGSEDDAAHINEVTYQPAIEADVSVSDCAPVDGQRFYHCLVSYSNMLFEAADAPPFVSEVRFEVISDGRIAPIPEDLYPGGNNGITLEWFLFEEEMGLAAQSPCEPYGSDPVACPALQSEHLDEFVAWRAGTDSPEAEAADIGFIERFVETWFESMDPMTAMTMIDVTAYPNLDDRTEDDQAHVNEITYQAAIEADVSVSDCVPTEGQRVFACTVSYSNMLFEAVGAPPSVTDMDFTVISDARMAPMVVDTYPGNNEVTVAWLRFEEEEGLGGQGACQEYGSDSVACPNLQREHLDAFAAWWAIDG